MSRARSFAIALAVLTLAACDGDGVSPFTPEADLAGTWVRDEPFDEPTLSSYWVPVHDTLVLRPDGTGRWSITIASAGAPMPVRIEQRVLFEPSGLRLHLWATPEPCEACRLADPRLSAPNWLVVRKGEDRLELRMLLDPSLEGLVGEPRLGEDVYRYRRGPGRAS